ncbi:DUF6176 family protein [Paeniglutamicibacter psychrophenolicus]|uniref:DUF6176 family protein n=1 Tax=Paeniglutamicibacter psychrophenolicus TaxID=257454 RepID=UPI0027876C51|nr:DUF6176 family protein [Paeniglutamicibacter psychrophenolicus]MDQ0094589.1 hypothetical protein [Paeniglutamicibacter psychrophenolicus]
MDIELSRFRVLPGKMDVVEVWLAFLNENMDAVLQTLEGERMLVETIFHEHLAGADYLYWFSIQVPGGIDVRDSGHWIDAKHLEYWHECIDPSYSHVDLAPKVAMLPARVRTGLESAAGEAGE